MNGITKILVLATAIGVAGCSSAPPVALTQGQKTTSNQMEVIRGKMNSMSPQQRADYIKAHPEEFTALTKS
jgi:starvation-inducible outer membrane lipoprotein